MSLAIAMRRVQRNARSDARDVDAPPFGPALHLPGSLWDAFCGEMDASTIFREVGSKKRSASHASPFPVRPAALAFPPTRPPPPIVNAHPNDRLPSNGGPSVEGATLRGFALAARPPARIQGRRVVAECSYGMGMGRRRRCRWREVEHAPGGCRSGRVLGDQGTSADRRRYIDRRAVRPPGRHRRPLPPTRIGAKIIQLNESQ